MKLLFSFIIALYCVLSLVLAQNTKCQTKCPDQINIPIEQSFCNPTGDGKCKCGKPLPNGECPAKTLPNCGNPIRRDANSCTKEFPVNHTQLCKHLNLPCSEIHYSDNLYNQCNCPNGTKAWPLLTSPWEITYYQNKSGPYGPRYVYRINNMSPGPTIHALKGDWILIPIFNNITKPDNITNPKCYCPEMATLHWHGVTMRGVERHTTWKDTEPSGFPFMDGVPGVSQCPIPACGRFDYFFQFVDSGTYWYHSHYEIQIADGLSGAMMVKDCNDVERFKNIYNVTYNDAEDFNDYIIDFKDWFNYTTAEEKQKKYMNFNETGIPPEPVPNTGLVNNFSGNPISPNSYQKFNFKKGNTYRLRLINTSVMTLFNFSIDDHEFEVVEIEGMIVKRNNKTKPDKFKSFNINVGQRVSILVTAKNETKVNPPTYWMRFHSKGCYFNQSQALDLWAVVCYNETDPKCPPPPEKVPDNSNVTCEDTIQDLEPHCGTNYTRFCKPPPPLPNKTVCKTFYFGLYIYRADGTIDEAKINDNDPWEQNILGYLSNYSDFLGNTYYAHMYNNMPNYNTLLGVYENQTTISKNGGDNKNIYKLDCPNGVYDIIFTNADPLEHPIHLHGHFFYVLRFGNLTTSHYENFKNPIQRDVFTIPPRGYAHIRFTADNPGVWPLHCHMDWHLGIGMMAQFMELPSVIAEPSPNSTNSSLIIPPETWPSLCTPNPHLIYPPGPRT